MSGKLRLALLDMYDGVDNLGMGCLERIAARFSDQIETTKFEVRKDHQIPDIDYDIYISSGGPGSPLPGDGTWEDAYFEWIDQLWHWNKEGHQPKKYALFICHSFQLACEYFHVGDLEPRNSTAFGIFKVHKTPEGENDPLLVNLPEPFYAMDSRDWQVLNPDDERLGELGAVIICLEKDRPHTGYERAVMGVRFSTEFVGVQFHPEAEPRDLFDHFTQEKVKKELIKKHGNDKYHQIIERADHPEFIQLTYEQFIPTFLNIAIQNLTTSRSLA